jgi:hypothetical protein
VRFRLAAAAAVAIAAFALYHATLLPGVDFGDTGSFQATVGSPIISPRDGYPLYFAIGDLFLWSTTAEPAHALNLASAVEGAVAAGLLVVVAADLSGSLVAAVAAALLFAGSYTFWTQAIIAEVYALHAVFIALTLLLLLRWEARPSTARLALFFAVYALGFGNHLSMVLLLPAYTLFLLLAAPGGWRTMFRPQIVGLALALAALGALQYAWNLRELWLRPHPPSNMADALQIFWFDVTKSDWRETMVGRVPQSMLIDRIRMYLFDLRQQFGWPVPVVALAGLAGLWRRSKRRFALLFTLYAVNVGFAFSYNVGDTHVFYIPSHLIVALLAGVGIGWLLSLADRAALNTALHAAVAVVVLTYAGERIYRDFPAVDRSGDERPARLLAALTAGLDDRHAILLTDLNWQIQNGLSYFTKITRPDVADARAPDVILYAPALVRDNAAIGREVAATSRARTEVASLFGPLLPTALDPRVAVPSLASIVARVPPGTPYVLAVLKPSRDLPLDDDDLQRAARTLGAPGISHRGDYAVLAGTAGAPPLLAEDASHPFERRVVLDGVSTDVRLESWLNFDTIRRMGFGQVIAAHRHALIVERGVSFVAFDANGRAVATAYASNIYAPQPRYLISWSP